MVGIKEALNPLSGTSTTHRLSIISVFLYQVLAVVIFAIVPFLAINWLSQPFLGVLLEHTLVANGVGPQTAGEWSGFEQGLGTFGVRVLQIDGTTVRSAREIQQVLRAYQVGDTVLVAVENGAEPSSLEVILGTLPLADQFALFYIPYILGLIYLACSLWVYSLRRNDAAGRAFVLFSTSAAIGLGALFDLYTTHIFPHVWTTAIGLAGSGVIMMGLLFPEEVRAVRTRPMLRWLPLIPALFLILNALPTLFNLSSPRTYVTAWQWEYAYTGLGLFFFIGLMFYRRFTSQSPIAREQAQIILWGSLSAFLPMASWFLITVIYPDFIFHPFLLLSLVIFPIAIAYAILRYRLLNTDYIVSRAVLYAVLSFLAVAIFVLLVWGVSFLLEGQMPANNPLLIGLMVFILAAAFNPIRTRMQNRINAVFFRGQTVYQEHLQEFSGQLTQTISLDSIIDVLRNFVEDSLNPTQLHVFLHDPLSDQYVATAANGRLTTDIRFSNNSALTQALSGDEEHIFIGDINQLPAALAPDRARLSLLGAQLFVTLPGREHISGWLALGPRKSGEPYSRQDLAFIESLGEQASLAIERGQVVSDLRRRVHEMNVLARVAQGVNVTIVFDDILELIYAQTVQVLNTQHFRITLVNPITNTFFHAFYVENDERLSEFENHSIPDGLGLEQDIVRSQRTILTEDYVRECRSRGLIPAAQGLYGWVGVPLNAGNETIGAVSLGTSDPSVNYTQDQQNLLQAIADHAAGAIVKTQLIQESKDRAEQLETLNQLGRSLTSTLDLNLLLNRILDSAVNILGCEAGSLFMIDEETDEMVFEVTIGPVAEDLTGVRLPPGTGLVGKSVETRQPIIVNNVQQSQDWFDQTDQDTGFSTDSMLVVPMQVLDKVIGIIEVLNKTDHSPFSEDDQRLLTAFTAQAAVAIQNARLFTMTDQALAARVDELSVMQRIDRELNTSLDLERVMRITLDWAMGQSRADAGLVAIYDDEESLRVTAHQGYDLDFMDQSVLDQVSEQKSVQAAVSSRTPQGLQHSSQNGTGSLMQSGLAEVTIPILREEVPIGLLFLETARPESFANDSMQFLTRLGDHAAIAISNAQFYNEVQAANIAKSDFISFVSHELKTPMTSIRGYADLLANGAVGDINDAQLGFLSTIRSNVLRMSTLVSDLADISQIEAGRLSLNFGAVGIGEIVGEVIRSTERMIAEKEQELKLNIPETLPQAWGDQTRLVQVMTNLISNAVKYTPKGGSIDIRASYVQKNGEKTLPVALLQGETAPNFILTAVHDSGIGLTDEDQEKIFTKFFRSSDQKAREAPGTGLGLNITKNLIEMQGGTIWFESEFRHGSTFYFTIPVAETD
jgi:signal transduction histidine kinase/putative methionine-R-sulfoxide reductase with GAF domain